MKGQLKSAIIGLWMNKWSTLMSVISIGICFFIVTGVYMVLYNLELFSKKLTKKAAIVIYLKEGVEKTAIAEFQEKLKNMGVFSKIQYIPKDEALKEMQTIIDPSLTEVFGFNPLSDTIEAFLTEEGLGKIETISKNIKTMQIVEDVYYPSKVIAGIKIIRTTIWNLGIAIFVLLSLAILFIVYAMVKNLYWKKTEEIEILKLLGATPSYIRAPFLLEGGIIGLAGAVLAELFIILIYFSLHSKNVTELLPAVTQFVFPVESLYVLPFFGMLLGMFSAFAALGKIKYQ